MYILLADDDDDDLLLIRNALSETGIDHHLQTVNNGEDLLHYLRRDAPYNYMNAPYPDIIMLDLNMPRKDGREALKELKSDPKLKRIPVVVFSTSKSNEDILNCYDFGANSFITKPDVYSDLVKVLSNVCRFWCKTVALPSK
jgi:CheY-like chemotaxis protein